MRRYWLVTLLVLLFFLAVFLIAELLNPSLLADTANFMNASTIGVALLGVVLLVADILLPVPSSLIMIANGALFGIVAGALLSLFGSLSAALIGFFIGRRGGRLLARVVPLEERDRADRLLEKWGWLAIIVTRPVPLLAETTAVMAGASSIGWRQMTLAAFAGSLPIAVLYALTGATAANFDNAVLTFGFVLLMAGLFWVLGRRFGISTPRELKGRSS